MDERRLHRHKQKSYGGHSIGRRVYKGRVDPARSRRAKTGG